MMQKKNERIIHKTVAYLDTELRTARRVFNINKNMFVSRYSKYCVQVTKKYDWNEETKNDDHIKCESNQDPDKFEKK